MVSKIEQYIKSNLIKLPNTDEKVINNCVEIIRPYLNNHTDLLKIDKWYREKNVAFKSNPVRFMQTTFVEELKKGTFDITPMNCDPHTLRRVLEKHGIKVKKHADVYLYTMFDYLYNEGYLNQAEIIECNRRAVKTLANQGKSTDDFIELYKNSNVSRERGFDWEAIEKEFKENKKRWEDIFDDTNGILENMRNTGTSDDNDL